TTIIFTFIWTYNDFFSQLIYLTSPESLTVPVAARPPPPPPGGGLWRPPPIYLTSPESLTVPVALRSLVDSSGGAYAQLLAMSVLSLVPTFIIFLVFQRRLARGVTPSG